jgi:hypothetical protein
MKKLSEITPVDAALFALAGLALAGVTVGLGSMAYKAAYCDSLDRHHVLHRNATASVGDALDRTLGQPGGYDYERYMSSLSDHKFNSLKRSNGCN